MDRDIIAQKLRNLRGKRTQEEVAKALGITVQSVSHYERGHRIPNDDMKVKIANFFGADVRELFFN